MTKERDDSEKRNLLVNQREDKKRRQYSGSRSKVDRRSCESSSSEHNKKGVPLKSSVTTQRAEFNKKSRTRDMKSNNDQKQKSNSEDTCSRVSCAFKRIISSEYACIGCLVLLFAVSIVVAFLMVFKHMPNICGGCSDSDSNEYNQRTTTTIEKNNGVVDSEKLKRKIDKLNDKRLMNGIAGLDEFSKNDKKDYDDVSGLISMPGVGIDFGPSFRELNSMDESDSRLSKDIDLSNVVDADKNIDILSSGKLREFYKKLIQTDAEIKSLKNINQDVPYTNDDFRKSPERFRRSIKLHSHPKRFRVLRPRRSFFDKHQKINENGLMERFSNRTKYSNEFEEPTGFIIEKQNVLVQYKPTDKNKMQFKKCSHAPKDSHTHEKQMMHPFYKNTQRIDELLDRFLNKNLPEIINDPFGLDEIFKHEKPYTLCKHHKTHKNVEVDGKDQIVPKAKGNHKNNMKEKNGQTSEDYIKLLRTESTKQFEKAFRNHESQMIGKEKKVVTVSPNGFEVVLSVSSVMNPALKNTNNIPVANFLTSTNVPMIERVPHKRRLMQMETNEDDENISYEDFKEVLTDEMDNHDEMDKTGDRKRRDYDQPSSLLAPDVHNPNWKDPIPLYPDEINSIMSHDNPNANKVELIPSTRDEIRAGFLTSKKHGRAISDVEDYQENKYDKLIDMAQAYSDYGVLDGKKESKNEKNCPLDVTATDHRNKLSSDQREKTGQLGSLKRGRLPRVMTSTAGSIRRQGEVSFSELDDTTVAQTPSIFNGSNYTRPYYSSEEIHTTTKAKEDDANILKISPKHVSMKPKTAQLRIPQSINFPVITAYADEIVYSTEMGKFTTEPTIELKTQEEIDREYDFFSTTEGIGNLLTTDFQNSDDIGDYEYTTGYRVESNRSSIDKFVQNLYLKKHDSSNKKALVNYIEKIKQKNIRIFSTPNTYGVGNSNSLTTATNDKSITTIAPVEVLNVDSETLVKIDKSEMKMDDVDDTGNNILGLILLTVQNPDIGETKMNLIFDVPLITNFEEELMKMKDDTKYPNVYNQSDIIDIPNATDLESDTELESEDNKTISERNKRENNISITCSNDLTNVTEVYTRTSRNTTVTTSSSNDNPSSTITSATVINDSESSDNETLSDFFSMISNWFKAFEDEKVDESRDSSNSGLTLTSQLLNNSVNETKLTTTDLVYPFSNSDLAENIGHRSRVLLSVEDNLDNGTEMNGVIRNTNVTTMQVTSSGGNVSNITHPTTPVTSGFNITTTKKEHDTKTNVPKKDKKLKVKAISKRNADDSNLIFWNDMYDDEYGIQTDKLDNSITDKHSGKENDFIKKSGRWVHDKIKKFAENLKINPHSVDVPGIHSSDVTSVHSDNLEIKERFPRSVKNLGLVPYPEHLYGQVYSHNTRREMENAEEDDYQEVDPKSIFTALSSNMKEVCKKAAKAVQETRNAGNLQDIKRNGKSAREDSDQGTIVSTLMQQLVRLLTELVDYQVQQKTCTKLPPELQNFLEWLILPEGKNAQSPNEDLVIKTPNQVHDQAEYLQEVQKDNENTERPNEMKPGDKLGQTDIRTHYLDCLHSIQDLLQQYEEMTDDEKSKMTGVKGYLESQMNFLNKQLSGYNMFTIFDGNIGIRDKRHIFTTKQHSKKHRSRRKLNKFIKNFGKKHTRTLAGYYDGVQKAHVTKRKTAIKVAARNSVSHQKVTKRNLKDVHNSASHQKMTKRNLKDVYYKAIADAKKYATVKNVHKKAETFETSTDMMQNIAN